MSFVPQYLIKRLLPMDCLHAVDNGVEIHAVNVNDADKYRKKFPRICLIILMSN